MPLMRVRWRISWPVRAFKNGPLLMKRLQRNHYIALALLEYSPFERHPRGGWRFGARRITSEMADCLVACGRAQIVGDTLRPVLRVASAGRVQ
ncbi:hypothetical protein ACQPTN_23830 [Bradyrhizobium sp. 13971]